MLIEMRVLLLLFPLWIVLISFCVAADDTQPKYRIKVKKIKLYLGGDSDYIASSDAHIETDNHSYNRIKFLRQYQRYPQYVANPRHPQNPRYPGQYPPRYAVQYPVRYPPPQNIPPPYPPPQYPPPQYPPPQYSPPQYPPPQYPPPQYPPPQYPPPQYPPPQYPPPHYGPPPPAQPIGDEGAKGLMFDGILNLIFIVADKNSTNMTNTKLKLCGGVLDSDKPMIGCKPITNWSLRSVTLQ